MSGPEGEAGRHRRRLARAVVLGCVAFAAADFIYKTANNITYLTREKCILYRSVPRPLFLAFEYVVELGVMVMVGVFFGRLLETGFARYQRLYPRNPWTAFLYGSLIPACACAAIPLAEAMRGRLNLRTRIAFVVSTPLLSPYILVLSFAVLGPTYTALRVLCSMALAVSAGYALQAFCGEAEGTAAAAMPCGRSCCPLIPSDLYLDTWRMFRRLLPWLLLAGLGGLLFEMTTPTRALMTLRPGGTLLTTLAVMAVGLPLYFSNGTEVLFLRPLIHHGGLSMGAAVAFSMTSTAVCITSFVMLLGLLGKRLTLILLAHIIVATLVMSVLIDLVFAGPGVR
jgi:uncharacterized membrane protein YraQ (UPF0718 family)